MARSIWQSRWTPAVVILALLGSWYVFRKSTPHQTFQLDGDMLVSGNRNLKEVCLTFDDGPHHGSMDKILEVLERENVRATFFVVGKMVDKSPELVRRMMSDGHEVGNHTYTHKRLNQMPIESARQEIAACAASVFRATGAHMNLLRPPGMEYNNDVLHLSQDMGYVTIHWNVVAADYVPVAPEVIYRRVMNQVKNGSVILLHDSPDTALALESIIKQLKSEGYRFVTTTQMLARLPRPVSVPSNAYAVKADPIVTNPTQTTSKIARKTAIAKPKVSKKEPTVAPVSSRKNLDHPTWDGTPNNEKEDIEGLFLDHLTSS